MLRCLPVCRFSIRHFPRSRIFLRSRNSASVFLPARRCRSALRKNLGRYSDCPSTPSTAHRNAAGFVGQPMKGVEVELIDPTAPAGQIQVRSAAVGDGYFPEADEEKLGGGIFVPDDLLAHDGPGFRIVGRISDVINVAGKKVNPAEVEAHLL